mgnify:CR=1 FL=1
MRSKILIGNWKMNMLSSEAVKFCEGVEASVLNAKAHNVICGVAPTFLALEATKNATTSMIVSAQNCHFENSGAFTGEVSVPMLVDLGIKYCLVGHSERRQYFAETNETCNKKMKKLFANSVVPVYCVGETLAEFEANETKNVINEQLRDGLEGIEGKDVANMVIAYEPVWSIGTGKNASSEIARDICTFIRDELKAKYGEEVAEKVLIQYGGSVKPNNIKEYLTQPNIDGALVGGASLKVDSFVEMIENLIA